MLFSHRPKSSFFWERKWLCIISVKQKRGKATFLRKKRKYFVTDPTNFLRTFLVQKWFWKGWQDSLEQQHITISLTIKKRFTTLCRTSVKQIQKNPEKAYYFLKIIPLHVCLWVTSNTLFSNRTITVIICWEIVWNSWKYFFSPFLRQFIKLKTNLKTK